jgi:hypothetical protein
MVIRLRPVTKKKPHPAHKAKKGNRRIPERKVRKRNKTIHGKKEGYVSKHSEPKIKPAMRAKTKGTQGRVKVCRKEGSIIVRIKPYCLGSFMFFTHKPNRSIR